MNEVFSEENYNLKVFKSYEDILIEYHRILELKNLPLVIDCGSNIGSSSVYFNKIFTKSNILSIEPDKNSYEFSKKNLKFRNSLLINKAVNCEENDISTGRAFEDHEQWDSLSAIVLHESLLEHYNLQIAIEDLGTHSVERIKELI